MYGKLCKENKQKQYASMPSIGTRVRRGEDWQYGNQDSYGVGTVTGHCDKGIKFTFLHISAGLLSFIHSLLFYNKDV